MVLTDEEKQYKIPIVKEGSKHFFAINSANNWDFESYFESTHNDISKYKQVSKIKTDYDADLNWIRQLAETPVAIKEYVLGLIKEEKPGKAALKANMSKRATKRRKMAAQTVNFNGPINGGTINNINNSEVHCTNDASSSRNYSAFKRKSEGEEEDAEEVSEKKQDVLNAEHDEPSIWLDFNYFIQSHDKAFHPYSPEANNIIRSGKGISHKPHLDRNLYNKYMEARNTIINSMPQSFHQYIDAFIDSNDLKEVKKKIRPLSLLLSKDEEDHDDDTTNLEFLEHILKEAHKSYSSHIDYNSSEDAFNQLFIWPYLNVIAKSITIDGCNPDFVQGSPYLESMSRQLKAVNLYVDDKNQYKSDGLVKLFGLNKLELLLLETSGSFSNKDKNKGKLDHHKGVYGALAMLKCIADDYQYATLKTFVKVKVFFLHAVDTKLHFWSICYQNGGVFDLWREADIQIKPDFQDKGDFLPDLVQFCWEVKCELNESMKNIMALKKEHNSEKTKYRYSSVKPNSLSNVINPIILKLTKEEDYSEMSTLGPCYSPSHP